MSFENTPGFALDMSPRRCHTVPLFFLMGKYRPPPLSPLLGEIPKIILEK